MVKNSDNLKQTREGFDGVKIVYKDASWCPSFWPTEMCDWMEVSNFSHWKASEYSGEGDLTMVLKKSGEEIIPIRRYNGLFLTLLFLIKVILRL